MCTCDDGFLDINACLSSSSIFVVSPDFMHVNVEPCISMWMPWVPQVSRDPMAIHAYPKEGPRGTYLDRI